MTTEKKFWTPKRSFMGWTISMMIFVSAFAILSNTVTWTDVGKISWAGQKFFNGDWHTPFAITTLYHGTLNFTYPDVQLTFFSQVIPPNDRAATSLPIGVVHYYFNTYKLVVDP